MWWCWNTTLAMIKVCCLCCDISWFPIYRCHLIWCIVAFSTHRKADKKEQNTLRESDNTMNERTNEQHTVKKQNYVNHSDWSQVACCIQPSVQINKFTSLSLVSRNTKQECHTETHVYGIPLKAAQWEKKEYSIYHVFILSFFWVQMNRVRHALKMGSEISLLLAGNAVGMRRERKIVGIHKKNGRHAKSDEDCKRKMTKSLMY